LELSPGVAYFVHKLDKVLFSSGSMFSLTSLFCAFSVAVAILAVRRYRRNRRIRIATLLRALFPRRIFTHTSTFADLGYAFFNIFVYSIVFGWAALSYQFLTNGIIHGLVATFGPAPAPILPLLASQALVTVGLFLAYEFGYWVHHYLCHRIPFLWEFHKVHHSADVLTPLTVFRVHPVDTWLFVNILAIAAAIANGVLRYGFGDTSHQYALAGTNIMLVLFIHAYLHLQHSHVWLSFRGLLGRILLSPAHHQVHHSDNPIHFNKNLGSCLAIWDWAFGTLYVPAKESERLSFGIGPRDHLAHTITGELFMPVVNAVRLAGGREQAAPESSDAAGAAHQAPQRAT
jgi:sterol desaturase/sphingolipid hydroxylase (fatty acid hydroxylase superfamily)